MGKIVIVFVILTAMLILGIFIMMKPHVFILQSQTNEKSIVNQYLVGRSVPKEIIILGSTFIVIALVGLSVLGFKIFKELKTEGTSEK